MICYGVLVNSSAPQPWGDDPDGWLKDSPVKLVKFRDGTQVLAIRNSIVNPGQTSAFNPAELFQVTPDESAAFIDFYLMKKVNIIQHQSRWWVE